MERHEEWLCKQLAKWETEGLLDSSSASRLRQKYSVVRPNAGMNIGLILLSCFGALLVGLGIIALFAANWGELTRPCRAVVSLLPLVICSCVCLAAYALDWRNRGFWEGLGLLWILAIWSGFGLVCQTYHMSDNVAGFVLACTMLCLPILYLTRSTGAIIAWPICIYVYLESDYTPWHSLTSAILLLFYLPAAYIGWRNLKHRGFYEFIVSLAVASAILDLIQAFLDYTKNDTDEILLLTSVAIGSIAWLLADIEHWSRQRQVGLLGLLVPCLFFPFSSIFNNLELIKQLGDGNYTPSAALAGLLLLDFASAAAPKFLRRSETNEASLEKPSMSKRHYWPKRLIVALLPLAAIICGIVGDIGNICIYLLVIVIAALALLEALQCLSLKQMNVSLCVLLYEILAKFLSSDWSFTAKGLILLGCGITLLVVNVIVIRKRSLKKQEVAA